MKVIFDPMHHHMNEVSDRYVQQNCHIVITWAKIAVEADNSILEVVAMHYGHPPQHMHGGRVLDNGIYKYPEDPDLYPLCHIDTEHEDIYFYFYDMLAVRNKETNETFITRVD